MVKTRLTLSCYRLIDASRLISESAIQWEIDFYPRGIRYNRAQLINVYTQHMAAKVDVPETILQTVRVKCTCKANLYDEQRFKVSTTRTPIHADDNVNLDLVGRCAG